TYSIKAHYGGDGAFGPSDSGAVPVSIGKQNPKVIVSFVGTSAPTTAAQSVAYGSPYILRVDVANNAGTPCENATTGVVGFICPTGTVALLDNNVALKDFPSAQTPGATNVATLNDRGFIEDQPIQLNVGTHPITATYTADANSSYISSTATNTLSITITQAPTTTAVAGSPTTITSGASVTLTATLSSDSTSAQGPTGTIQFQNGGVNIGSPVTCTPKGATSSAGASCTATLSTTLSALPPFNFDGPMRRTPFECLAPLPPP